MHLLFSREVAGLLHVKGLRVYYACLDWLIVLGQQAGRCSLCGMAALLNISLSGLLKFDTVEIEWWLYLEYRTHIQPTGF
jgi:hypothetical protein